MNFFKSVFSDDADDQQSDPDVTPPTSPKSQSSPDPNPNPNPSLPTITTAWTFGSSLIKTLASKSESVIETYRRDLEDFGSGLKKETAVIRQAATRAVQDLPASLEAGAAAAQESLESVGGAIDNLGTTFSEIIVLGKDSILAASDSDSENYSESHISSSHHFYNNESSSRPYSRLDAQVRSIQCDMNTYCVEPEDLDEYNEWKLRFVLDERGEEIEDLIGEDGAVADIYREIVPNKVDRVTFWSRYFYRVYKVKKAEEARAKLVKRAISGEEEEELSWDVDDDDYKESDVSKLKVDSQGEDLENDSSPVQNIENSGVVLEKKDLERKNDDKSGFSEPNSWVDQKGTSEGRLNESETSGDVLGSEEKTALDGKIDNGGSCKDSDFSVISSQVSPEEEDLGWDDIEDMGSSDENKVASHGSPNRGDIRKRLSAAEDDEDLTWDIEDDDEPVKS